MSGTEYDLVLLLVPNALGSAMASCAAHCLYSGVNMFLEVASVLC